MKALRPGRRRRPSATGHRRRFRHAIAVRNLSLLAGFALFAPQVPATDVQAALAASIVADVRHHLGLETYDTGAFDAPAFKSMAAVIFTTLANTHEHHIHRMQGADSNRVMLHSDGQSEAVFEFEHDAQGAIVPESGVLVTDCMNEGTYNLQHPYDQPLGHFTVDILPWLIWSSCDVPRTSTAQRVRAYVQDFGNGFRAVTGAAGTFFLPTGFEATGFGESEALSFFFAAFRSADFDLAAFAGPSLTDPATQEAFLEALERGMNVLLSGADP